MAARVVPAAAVLTAAVVVFALVQSRRSRRMRRELERELVSHRLMEGCMARDLEVFRRRLDRAMVQDAVAATAVTVLDEALSTRDRRTPPTEGGPR